MNHVFLEDKEGVHSHDRKFFFFLLSTSLPPFLIKKKKKLKRFKQALKIERMETHTMSRSMSEGKGTRRFLLLFDTLGAWLRRRLLNCAIVEELGTRAWVPLLVEGF